MSLWIDADVLKAAVVGLTLGTLVVLFFRFTPRREKRDRAPVYQRGAPKVTPVPAERKYRGLGQAQD